MDNVREIVLLPSTTALKPLVPSFSKSQEKAVEIIDTHTFKLMFQGKSSLNLCHTNWTSTYLVYFQVQNRMPRIYISQPYSLEN